MSPFARVAELERENTDLREELAAWRSREDIYRRGEVAAARLDKLRKLASLRGPGRSGVGRLILVLIDRSPELVGRERLLSLIAKDPTEPPNDNTLSVLTCYARKGLERLGHPAYAIETICGEGYRLRHDVAISLRQALGEAA